MPEFATPLGVLSLWAMVAYFIGSIPSGILIARAMGLGNLREIGSGNIGATNVLRTGSKKAAASTLALDAGKGLAAVWLASFFAGPTAAQVAGFAVMIGHCFPVWLKFRGGKGVATFFGVVFALAWPLGLVAAVAWLGTAYLFRYSSLAALVAVVAAPVAALLVGFTGLVSLLGCLCALIVWRHAENIRRLLAGTESKIGKRR